MIDLDSSLQNKEGVEVHVLRKRRAASRRTELVRRLVAWLSSIRPEPLHLQVEDEMRAGQHPEDERLA